MTTNTSKGLRAAVFVAALGALSACQTAGTDGVFSGILPDGSNSTTPSTPAEPNQPAGEQVAAAPSGSNPNARTNLKNTRNALSEYCPAVRIRAGTETLRSFPEGADKEDEDNLRYQAVISQVARECAYVGQNLKINIGARGRIITGPKGGSGDVTMPIRVAVTVGRDTVYSKLHRPVQTIPAGRSNATFQFVDNEVIIPAPTATNVRVFVGFDEGPYNTP
ncbi:hypothetical protein ACFQ14_05880 [Pseudahrensia aquimaris]|uniref:Lipoprotein n=2 Tax=Pseudahrensia aquimaris TaxID=744461 RepID=A0ABW3FF76_9HYPH